MIFNKVIWVQSVLAFTLSIGLLKISIGLNLLRLGGGTSTWYKWCNWIVIAYVIEYTVQGVVGFALMCRPLEAYWDTSIKDYTCESQSVFKALSLLNTASNIATDVAFASSVAINLESTYEEEGPRIFDYCAKFWLYVSIEQFSSLASFLLNII